MSISSSVGFKSNIYPVKGMDCLHDREFLSVIHDPYALTEFKRLQTGYTLTPIQREEQQAAQHCTYAEPGEFPWGTVLVDGEMVYVCRCENYHCLHIGECRPGFLVPGDASQGQSTEIDESNIQFEKDPDERRQTTEEVFDATTLADEAKKEEAEPYPLDETFGTNDSVAPSSNNEQYSPNASSGSNDPSIDGSDPLEVVEPENESAADDNANPSFDNSCKVPGRRYDQDQRKIVEADVDRRIYVNAGPGTGKTFTLIERLKYLISNGIPGNKILVLSYTRAAVAVMKERLRAAVISGEIDADWQAIDITTFDKFCTQLLYFIKTEENPQLKINSMDYDQRVLEAKLIIQKNKELLAGVSHLIVDETQDLVGPRADLVLATLESLSDECGFTLLGDRCQSLYDYQTKEKPSLTTSERFYDLVVEWYRPDEIGLTRNYRQKGNSSLNLQSIRRAILERDVDGATRETESAVGALPKPETSLRELESVTLACGQRLGILTRTNAQALEASSLLWKIGIRHEISRSSADRWFTRSIADSLMGYRNETMDADSFKSRLRPEESGTAEKIWKELRKMEGVHPEGSRLRVEEVLQAIAATMPSPEISAIKDDHSQIFVGTIHSAKGREFDKVWLLAEDLSAESFADDLDECKVAYVGLSRAIGEITLQCIDEHYLIGGKKASKSRQFGERYVKKYVPRRRISGRGAGSRITNMEILDAEDIDFKSQAADANLQEFISGYLKEGTALRLEKESSVRDLAPTYRIVLDEQRNKVLGHMQMTFAESYAKAAGNQKYPDAFDEVYVDAIITCTGKAAGAPSGATKFGHAAVWHGFTIGGFAHRDDPQGY